RLLHCLVLGVPGAKSAWRSRVVMMQRVGDAVANYVRETRRLESLPSTTETSFYPDLKTLLSAVLKNERLPFEVIIGTSEGGALRRDMLDFLSSTTTTNGTCRKAFGRPRAASTST